MSLSLNSNVNFSMYVKQQQFKFAQNMPKCKILHSFLHGFCCYCYIRYVFLPRSIEFVTYKKE